jgi:phage baseplate assembly protein W
MARAFSIEDGGTGKTTTVKTTKNREYIDLDLSFAKKGSGDVYKKTSLAAIKQSIKLLLMTNRTEKIFSPYHGANLQQYLFELGDRRTISDIKYAITQNIKTFEPRVDPKTLKVLPVFDEGNNTLEVTIIFNVVNSNESVEFTTQLNRLR